MWIGLYAALLLLLTIVNADAQVWIRDFRSYAEASNLELVTLQGVVHLSRPRQRELAGKCGAVAFMLEDETGSIEVAVRRPQRLLEPLREGDRVQVTAQVEVLRTSDNLVLRICIEARDIKHVTR